MRGARGALVAAARIALGGLVAVPGGASSGELFVDGDSLAVGMRPHIGRELPGWEITHSVAVGRHTSEGVAVLRALGPDMPPVIHVSLGTNDDPRRVSRFRSRIREVLEIVGPDRCVVWTNIIRPPVAGASYARYNRALARESRPEERLRVVNWARLRPRQPGLAREGRRPRDRRGVPWARPGRGAVGAPLRLMPVPPQLSDGSAGIVASSR